MLLFPRRLRRQHPIKPRLGTAAIERHHRPHERTNRFDLSKHFILIKNRVQIIFEMCVIPFLVCRHSKHSIDDGMLVGDRPIDTKVATGVWGPHHVKCSKRMIHIPRQKLKTVRFRLKINVVVLRSAKKTVEITYHHVAGEESQELIDIEIVCVSF